MGGKWEEDFYRYKIIVTKCPMLKILFLYLIKMSSKHRERGRSRWQLQLCFPGLHPSRSLGNQHSLVGWCSVKEPEGLKWQEKMEQRDPQGLYTLTWSFSRCGEPAITTPAPKRAALGPVAPGPSPGRPLQWTSAEFCLADVLSSSSAISTFICMRGPVPGPPIPIESSSQGAVNQSVPSPPSWGGGTWPNQEQSLSSRNLDLKPSEDRLKVSGADTSLSPSPEAIGFYCCLDPQSAKVLSIPGTRYSVILWFYEFSLSIPFCPSKPGARWCCVQCFRSQSLETKQWSNQRLCFHCHSALNSQNIGMTGDLTD